MTDFHCRRCRKHITVYTHQKAIYCECGTRMRLGHGHRTRYDPWAARMIEAEHQAMQAEQLHRPHEGRVRL